MINSDTKIMIPTEREGTNTYSTLIQGENQGIAPVLVHAHALEGDFILLIG